MYYSIFLFLFCFLFPHKIENIQLDLIQPNGDLIECYASGDQYYHWAHDSDGYSIIQNSRDGYYYYAKNNNGEIVPSEYIVGTVNPNEVDLNKNVIINKDSYIEKRNSYWNNIERRDAPSIGVINNINVFIRFEDESEFPGSRNFYDAPFNDEQGPSMGHYFNEVSYDLLTVNTIHFPETENMSVNVSYQDQYPRSYYQPYNETTNPNGYQNDNQSRNREHNLLKNAIESIETEVPADLDIDSNNDGYVDNVTFLVRGSPGAWSSLLWPHRWVLYSENVYLNGSRVYDYNLNLEQGGYFTVGTLCHEFFHSLGAPDLYHYWDDTAPVAVGGWDVMDQSSNTPQSMSAFMKYRYTEWINDIPILNYGGRYQLSPLSEPNNNILRINSPSSNTEYFVVEYRVREGIYEVNTPGGEDGMIIYRVNSEYSGNANGPPDELYVYRTGGTATANGTFSGAVFNSQSGRDKFNDNTDPSCFLSDNSQGGINIANISNPGDVISFDLINMILLPEFNGISYDSDGDGSINPGEEILVNLTVSNLSNINADNVTLNITSQNNNVSILNNEIVFDSIDANQTNESSIVVNISENGFGVIPFDISVSSNYVENNQEITYNDNFNFNLEVTINQSGFPYSTTNEIHSSPLVVDLNSDGSNEIIFGDHFGEIRAIDQNASEALTDIFPFPTDNQIWGSPVLDDIDLDNNLDIAFVSKNGILYVFDKYGLKWSYQTDSKLIGTPSIGNVNESSELEIIVAGYSNNQDNFYVFSSDGILIDQISITEKIRSGFSLADVNGNGVDDIVFGTDDDNLYLIYDLNNIAEGYPFQASNKFSLKPLIIEHLDQGGNNTFLIVASNKNKIIYGLELNGDLRFQNEFNYDISTSSSVLVYQNSVMVFSGFSNGDIFWHDLNGNMNFFKNINSEVVGEVVFADLDSDLIPEIIAVNDIGEVHILNVNGDYYQNFPIDYHFPFSSSPLVYDLDGDSDFEIIVGTTNEIVSIDIKEVGLRDNYWCSFSNGFNRKSFFEYYLNCILGDVNQDDGINVLDVVSLVNIIFYNDIISDNILCVADLNYDELINVQDIILLVDYIFYDNN